MGADDSDSFFSRWSRRKAQERAGVTVPADAPVTVANVPAPPPVDASTGHRLALEYGHRRS